MIGEGTPTWVARTTVKLCPVCHDGACETKSNRCGK